MWTVLTCAVIGAVLNRLSGVENFKNLPGRNIFYTSLALFVIASLTVGGWWALALTLGALTYRIPGWDHSADMGTVADTPKRDIRVMFIRGLYFCPPFLYALLVEANGFAPALLILASAGATAAYYFGNHYLSRVMKDPFNVIEPLAGASFGAAIGCLLA